MTDTQRRIIVFLLIATPASFAAWRLFSGSNEVHFEVQLHTNPTTQEEEVNVSP